VVPEADCAHFVRCAWYEQVLHHFVFCRGEDKMTQTAALESAIRQELARVGTCSLDELNERLPYYSWNLVFSAVIRLNRMGILSLEHSGAFHYQLSLVPRERYLTPRSIEG
jgi:hypothetical protein